MAYAKSFLFHDARIPKICTTIGTNSPLVDSLREAYAWLDTEIELPPLYQSLFS